MARFRQRFNTYAKDIQSFNQRNGTNLQAVVKPFVDKSVWKQTSRRYLHAHHATGKNEEPDDMYVHNYIMRKGDYAKTGRNKPFVRDPLQQLKDLAWNTKQQALERRLAAYISKWDEIQDELGGDSMIENKTLAPIMLNAVRPIQLRNQIEDRIATARPPDNNDQRKAKWRLNARKNPDIMYRVIRENARYFDDQRASGVTDLRKPKGQDPGRSRNRNLNNNRIPEPDDQNDRANQYNNDDDNIDTRKRNIREEICRQHQLGRCRYREKCLRIHTDVDAGQIPKDTRKTTSNDNTPPINTPPDKQ